MKLKELAAATDISERTIRYYISDGVFVPEKYSESYTGRKSYDYTENDVKHLKQIALLRKYGFSIKDIKTFFDGEADIITVLKKNIEHSKEIAQNQNKNISIMESVLKSEPKTVNELCESLSTPVIEQAPVPNIDEQSAYKPMYERLRKKIWKIILIIIIFFALIGILYIISIIQKVYWLQGIENVKINYQVTEQLVAEQTEDIESKHFYSTLDGYFHNTVYEDCFGREYTSTAFAVSDYTPYKIDITIQNNSHATIIGSRLVGEYSKSCILTFDNYDDAAWMAEEIQPNKSKTVTMIIWFNNSLTDNERKTIIDNLDFLYEMEIDIGFLNSYEPYYFFTSPKR